MPASSMYMAWRSKVNHGRLAFLFAMVSASELLFAQSSLVLFLVRSPRSVRSIQEAAKPTRKYDFVVSPSGLVLPVPEGSGDCVPLYYKSGQLKGYAFRGSSQVLRLMYPVPAHGACPGYPQGYAKYDDLQGRGIDPYTGLPLSNKFSHYSLE